MQSIDIMHLKRQDLYNTINIDKKRLQQYKTIKEHKDILFKLLRSDKFKKEDSFNEKRSL